MDEEGASGEADAAAIGAAPVRGGGYPARADGRVKEREIRKKIIEKGRLDAVIGLAPNLFYGTGIPACVLVLHGAGPRPAGRKGKVLFINADREFTAGRAQNYLDPKHVEKIVTAYHDYTDASGFARVVAVSELAENDFNLNIRRYVDNAPPPEPQDVRAHLHGGVPEAEVRAHAGSFAASGRWHTASSAVWCRAG